MMNEGFMKVTERLLRITVCSISINPLLEFGVRARYVSTSSRSYFTQI